jgi:hypothetical protein
VRSSISFGNVKRSLALALALGAAAGCTSAGDATASADQQASRGGTAFEPRPRMRLLFTAKAKVPAATAEAYIKDKVLPLLKTESRVGEITTYVDPKGTYYVEVELRTASRPQLSLAIDVFSVGRTPKEAEALISDLGRYFDVSASQLLTKRVDLSISRNAATPIGGPR